jgi:pyridine nucleotide-disulfide oxidoreductase family protein
MTRLVLVGAGHAHAQVLLALAQQRATTHPAHDQLDIILVAPTALAPYSGMIPGWLAGHYPWQACCIDFEQLCRRAGAQLRLTTVSALDPDQRLLRLDDGAEIHYDQLSLNIGSTLQPVCDGTLALLPMRPLSALHQRWTHLQEQVRGLPAGSRYRVIMVGGGTAGVESILAAKQRLTQLAPKVHFEFSLVTQGADIMSGMTPGVARRLHRHLATHQVTLINHFPASAIRDGALHASDGRTLAADAVLWATGAQAHQWPGQSTLNTDERGFIRIDRYLRSVSHPTIFAAGDCASWQVPLPKAGVFAVRMGPVLTHNLFAAVAVTPGQTLRPYQPQQRYLMLISTGVRYAVACWGPLSWQGAWVWRWKDRIDQGFLARFNLPSKK